MIRLGIPLLTFFFILDPVTVFIAAAHSSAAVLQQEGISTPLTFNFQFYISNLGTGPLWFVEMLLIFDIAFALTRAVAGRDKQREKENPLCQRGALVTMIKRINSSNCVAIPRPHSKKRRALA